MRNLDVYGKYFNGNEVSEYGQKYNKVDYATFAKAFNAVLANDLMNTTSEVGYWEPINEGGYYEDANGNTYNEDERTEKIEELEEKQTEIENTLEDIQDRLETEKNADIIAELERDYNGTRDTLQEIEENLEALQEYRYNDIYQWYIVDNYGAELCEAAGETLYYNETLDIYLWGVDHWGTSWDYVLTNISCNVKNEEIA